MNGFLSYTANRIVVIACVVVAGIVGFQFWGYYRGLNVLITCSALCLAGSLIYRNKFLLQLAICVSIAYLTLSSVTIAQ